MSLERKTKRPKHVKCSHCGKQTSVIEHGTVSAYTTYGCRCDACRKARKAYEEKFVPRKTSFVRPYKKEDPLW